jgi:hypothetical protein
VQSFRFFWFYSECLDYTEIVVHDSGTRLASLMYYDGISNYIYIGRDKGYGVTNTKIYGNLILANDKWIYSSDAAQRIYFAANSTTYYQGYGISTAYCHIFKNNDGTEIMGINNNGNFFTLSMSLNDSSKSP